MRHRASHLLQPSYNTATRVKPSPRGAGKSYLSLYARPLASRLQWQATHDDKQATSTSQQFVAFLPSHDSGSSSQALTNAQKHTFGNPLPSPHHHQPTAPVPALLSTHQAQRSLSPAASSTHEMLSVAAAPTGSPAQAGEDFAGNAAAHATPPAEHPSTPRRSASSSPPRSSASSSSSSDGDGSGAAQAASLTDGSGVPAGASPGSQSVAAALARAQQALQQVESSLDGIEKLPSSRPPTRLHQGLLLARSVALLLAACAAIVASHAFGLLLQWGGALAGGAAIALWGLRRNSLAVSGAVAAFVVGAGTLGCSLRFGATLLAFYLSSSQLTRFKEELKVGLDDAGKLGGQRDWKQVLCNGLVPTCLAVAYGVLAGCVDVPLGGLAHLEPWRCQLATLLGGAFLGYYACCCGDTWASELGPLSSDTPRLITSLRPVRRGTNGGVTLLGLSASLMGGMWVGAVFYAAALVSPTLWIFEGQHAAAAAQWRLIPLGLMAGLVGSVVDSLLGATLQYSGFNRATGRVTSQPGPLVTHIAGRPWLDNNAVNILSASLTAALTALATLKTFGG